MTYPDLRYEGIIAERERIADLLDSKGHCAYKLTICYTDGNCVACWKRFLEADE